MSNQAGENVNGQVRMGFAPPNHHVAAEFDPALLAPFPSTLKRYHELLGETRNATRRRQIGNVARALLALHARGDGGNFSLTAVGGLTERMHGPYTKSLSNPSSSHHRTLIDTFAAEVGAAPNGARSRSGSPEEAYDEVIRALDKPHHRVAVRELVQGHKALTQQVRTLRGQLASVPPPVVSLRPEASGPVPAAAAGERAAEDARTQDLKRVVRDAFGQEALKVGGLEIDDGGALVSIQFSDQVMSPTVLKSILALAAA